MPTPKPNWEIEFDEKLCHPMGMLKGQSDTYTIKQFITNLLEQRDKELCEKYYADGYADGLVEMERQNRINQDELCEKIAEIGHQQENDAISIIRDNKSIYAKYHPMWPYK